MAMHGLGAPSPSLSINRFAPPGPLFPGGFFSGLSPRVPDRPHQRAGVFHSP
jgi:hypothetical protein